MARATVPKATVNKNGDARPEKGEIRSCLRDARMFPIAKTAFPKGPSEEKLRCCIVVAHSTHDPATLCLVEAVVAHVSLPQGVYWQPYNADP